ncbi:hypothetical protein ACJX0J_024879, partial [Zea mays]
PNMLAVARSLPLDVIDLYLLHNNFKLFVLIMSGTAGSTNWDISLKIKQIW